MNTDSAAEDNGPTVADGTAPGGAARAGDGPEPVAEPVVEPAGAEAGEPDGDTADGDAADGETGDGDGGGNPGSPDAQAAPEAGTASEQATPEQTEAAAELAAQRELRERIARRKAEREGPVDAGAKLSGKAADLLAAVRAVESGEKPSPQFFDSPAPAPEPRRPARPEAPARPRVPRPEHRPEPPAAERIDAVRAVLTAGGAPEALAPQVAEVLGEHAEDALRADPWRLLAVPGVRPEQADGFARALLGDAVGPGDERRGRALTGWLLERAALEGHTVLEASRLTAALARQGVPDAEDALRSAIEEGEVLVFQEGGLPDEAASGDDAEAGGTGDADDTDAAADAPRVPLLIGLERYALAEESLADALGRLLNAPARDDGPAPDADAWAAGARGSATELIRAAAGHGLVLHSGGEAATAEPAALAAAALKHGLRVSVAAHTADGRRRAAALLDGPPETAVTVAGLLDGSEGPGRDAEGAFALDLLVVLDAPALDVETAALLAESLPDGARLVLSGDPAVLWSAGAGRVFADLAAARVCPLVVSRTPDPGPIGELLSGIGIGELEQVEAPGKEVVIVPARDPGEAVHRTVQLVADSVPRAIGVPAEQTQVVTPGHGGAAGTRALNAALKERLNPGPGRFGGFDPGDRVVYSPATGRAFPGTVVGADPAGLRLDCGGDPVLVPREAVERQVRHGWAMTAHQAVGRRWPAAVVVLPGDTAPALTRSWVYTAFGRGERHLSVVHGVDQALPRAVAGPHGKERTTRLTGLVAAQVPVATG
ncbi:helix-hairpin-helix domain-containing protein [Streptomyces sp. NPDC060194]|uniref:helix-hairpin-helix domain-containing protein n=1 Tax=Streptomyces sp. NPDC060194 TaxID=3347069 RepID=UPI00366A16E4